jgi:hypothetical protein
VSKSSNVSIPTNAFRGIYLSAALLVAVKYPPPDGYLSPLTGDLFTYLLTTHFLFFGEMSIQIFSLFFFSVKLSMLNNGDQPNQPWTLQMQAERQAIEPSPVIKKCV